MRIKRILDVIMFVLLLFLMAFFNTGQTIHEILGIVMFLCFILHHILNYRWYRTLINGKYPLIKKVFIIINTLLLLVVIMIVLSGLSMSRLLPFLNFMSVSVARRFHLQCTYWGFLLMAIHLGLHAQSILMLLKRQLSKQTKIMQTIFAILPYGIAIYGIIVFIKNQWIAYLILLNEYVLYDETISIIQVLIEHIGIFVLFVLFTHYLMKNLVLINSRKEIGK